MKTVRLFWGIGFILLAVVFLLDAMGVLAPITGLVGELSLFTILLGLFILSFTVSRLLKGKIAEIFVPLSILFMLFEKNIAQLLGREDPNLLHNGVVFGCAVLLSIGVSILFSGTGGVIAVKTGKSKKGDGNTISGTTRGNSKNHLSAGTVYIDAATFQREHMENDLGSLTVRFENAEAYPGGGILYVENNLGSTVIEVPAAWHFQQNIETTLGAVSGGRNGGTPGGPLLTIQGENNLGSVSIRLT